MQDHDDLTKKELCLTSTTYIEWYASQRGRNCQVLLSSELSWSAHIESICIKARKLTGLLYRRFYGNVNQQSMYSLYSILVRPHLEYVAPIWDPHLIKDVTKLEKICNEHVFETVGLRVPGPTRIISTPYSSEP